MYAPPASSPSLTDRNTAVAERRDLECLGFTTEQIERLLELRAAYPLVEFVDSREELMRLMFLKWLHAKWMKALAEGRVSV